MSNLKLKLLIPGLLQPLELWHKDFAFTPQSTVFSKFLASIRYSCHRVQGYEHNLFYYNKINVKAELPAAKLLYYLDHQKWPQGSLLCAELMHLEGGIDELILHPQQPLNIKAEEQMALVTKLHHYFQEDGWRLENGGQGRTYLFPNGQVLPKTTPPSEVIGKNVLDYLPHTEHRKSYLHWHRILTEIQMLLHDSPINHARESAHRSTINTLWLWGGGKLSDDCSSQAFNGILGGDALSQALANYQHISWQKMPKGDAFKSWLEQAEGDYLLILDDLLLATQSDDINNWQQHWQRMQTEYFAPLYECWQKNDIQLQITFANGSEISPQKTAWRFWRRKKRDLLDLLL